MTEYFLQYRCSDCKKVFRLGKDECEECDRTPPIERFNQETKCWERIEPAE